ncbi:tripartite tricarboxylate transporter substrate binding protein [Variovorax sp. OV329]|uniref:Bug family tripartite tricarboxylate transporter substrate binding protein n=1 Tax=Variovorax sp. OV329 TaxID=1882825 RepID=UPI0008E56026|nr:tripartite tricarboxylate transporter substrate binding protein [Variovorax sp. OV329]SFN04013.1 Tripartite-type tricarboxylate transporter, receptor component TctC [Variovorax sp. OV329]
MSASLHRRRLLAAALALPALGSAGAAAPAWPVRPIRLFVVYPAGGVSDLMARALADPLAERLGVPVLVEHRPGAGGSVGIDLLARSAPDGHTLAFSAISPLTLSPLIERLGQADRLRSVDPVGSVMRTPVLVVATPAFQGAGFHDLLLQARAAPGALRWATSGVATTGHLVLAQVRALAGVEITHVPYQGGGPQLNDALGGQFEILSSNVAAQQLRYIEQGRLRALAVGSPTRLSALPNVPTLAELGFEPANRDSLFGIFAPPDTPRRIVRRINIEINRALAGAGLRERLLQSHNLPAPGSIDAFTNEIELDRQRNVALVERDPHAFD